MKQHNKRTFMIRLLYLMLMPLLFILFSYTGAHALLNENCTVSILNRTAQVKPDGKWIIPNVPSNMGKVRARATCVENGITRSGQSDWIEIQTDGGINIGDIPLEEFIPPPSSVKITVAATLLTSIGASNQLAVTAAYPDGTTKDITNGAAGTVYRTTNPAIATVSQNGVVTATGSGNVIISASNDMVLSSVMFSVIPGNSNDADNDGLPDGWELGHGLNPNNAIDAIEDTDHDGLTNKQEYDFGTDLRIADSDDDGIQDGEETVSGEDGYITNPLLADSDGDGIRDGLEVQSGSNPLNAGSYNLAGTLSGIEIIPSNFVLIYNTIIGDATRQLTVTGVLRDGTRIDLTSSSRGTNLSSSDLNIVNFGTTDGLVYAGQNGVAEITAINNGFNATAHVTVRTLSPTPLSYVSIPGSGYANNVDVAGGYAYIAGGAGGLYVVDVSNPNSPYILSSSDTPGTAIDIRADGNLVYIADGESGLQILDISNPASPVIVGSIDTTGIAQDIVISGTKAFIADGQSGLQIIDVSNPALPLLLGSVDTPGTAKGVAVRGNLAVIADGLSIRVIDISNPAVPQILGSVSTPDDAKDLTVRENYAYIADFSGGLQIVDFSNPYSPVIIGSLPSNFAPRDVELSGQFAFLAEQLWPNVIGISDVTDPVNPIFRGVIDLSPLGDYAGTGIAVTNNYVYVTEESFYVGIDYGTTGNTRLFIGQYADVTDDGVIPPTLSITSPLNGAEVIEGAFIPVNVSATDDVMVASVSVQADGEVAGSDDFPPFRVNVQVPVGITSLVLGATAIDLANNIGTAENVYLSVIRNQPPSASITAPSAGGTYMEGSTIILSADGSDDVGVSNVVFLVNGGPVFTDSLHPYKTEYVIPELSSGQMTISAKVEDTIGRVSYSPDVIINIIPDPKTTVRGRVLDINGLPISGAVVTLSNEQGISGITDADGSFLISGLPTVHGDIGVIVNVTVNGALLHGQSIGISPVAGGITEFGDVSAKEYELWAWGNNYDGQLGIPSTTTRISGVKAVAAGTCHSVAVKQDGTVWTWGCNYFGQLGDGTTVNRNTPVQVTGLTDVVSITAGDQNTFAVKIDGTVWAWGYNYDGELGDGTTDDRNTPVQVTGLTDVVSITAGGRHTFAVKIDGTVWAWGYNVQGQLGDGTVNTRYEPVQVNNLSSITAVSAGYNHSIALKDDGTVWSWGFNSYGQLGDGTQTTRYEPVPVSNLSGITAVSTGNSFSIALKEDGTVWSWGFNSYGQLGDGTKNARYEPVPVSNISNIVNITAGTAHSVVLRGDGTMWGWGDNAQGEVKNYRSSWFHTPVQITEPVGVEHIAAGGDHTIAVLSDGSVRAWGDNRDGQLGDGTNDGWYTRRIPAKITGVTGFTSIAAGENHTLGILSDGTLWGWGSNNFGQVGTGDDYAFAYSLPVQAAGLTGITSVAAGYRHSAALNDDGTVWTWGNNWDGQLGDGTTTGRSIPVQVSNLTEVRAIAAGGTMTIALKNDGTVWAWGDYNDDWNNSLPTQITGIDKVVTISAGRWHAVFLKDDGSVWIWNARGPAVQVTGLTDVVSIASGELHTVAVKRDGTVWAWGDNGSGQLGDGTTDNRDTPVQVTGLTDVVSIAAGNSHTVAVKIDGTVWTWGNNGSGQLGDGTTNNRNTPVQVTGITGATSAIAGGQHTLVIK